MYCQKCGAENLENAAMCQQCGGVFVYSKPTRTSGMAITSTILGISGYPMFGVCSVTLILGLIFGILALITWILSLVFGAMALIIWIFGLVFGMMALSRVGKSGGQVKGRGFSITGIITSATGLAVLLTVVGVVVFLNSASNRSLHKKLETHGLTQTAAPDEKPQINGWVTIICDKTNADNNCVEALFSPEQREFANVTTDMTCGGKKGQIPLKVSWQFGGQKGKSDIYNFTITVPVSENSSGTTKKTISYDGTEQVIFEDAQRKISVRPEN